MESKFQILERYVNMDTEGWLGQWGPTQSQVWLIKKDFTEGLPWWRSG